MSPRRRVLLSAINSILILTALAVPVHAQFYDAARGSVGFSLDAIERSPRLLGMGGLTFVGDDPHTAITLWDFAASPLGILEADSANTAELYPATSSFSQVHDSPSDAGTLERQDRAARESRVAYEIWRRTGGKSAFGVAGDFGSLRTDQIFSETVERRSTLIQPAVMPVLMGHMPFVRSTRWLYSVRLFYSGEAAENQYRGTSENSKGQYIDQDGLRLDPPNFFVPTDFKVRSMGGGLGVAYDRGRILKAAVSMDIVQNRIVGKNESPRRVEQNDEKRPYSTTQATLVGRLGRSLEWGVDGRDWRSQSEERWFFSISAGIGGDALVGRGKFLEREERGQALRTRLRWTRGPFELGGGLVAGYRRIIIVPPGLEDVTSFNHFRNTTSYRSNADSLVLADSVVFNRSEERTWEAGGGVAMQLPGKRGSLGVEYRRRWGLLEQSLLKSLDTDLLKMSGRGPRWKGWDLRTGLEYRCNQVLTGRVGYAYRWEDQDDYTQQNEYLANTVTLGLGLRPAGAFWTFEAGYAIEWRQADYGSPAEPRSSRQQLASMVRWAF
jgi:hypothetical protein